MKTGDVIVVTGAAGFIASYLTGYLNQQGFDQLILVDQFTDEGKLRNLEGKQYIEQVERADFFTWAATTKHDIKYIFHLGARTDTTEMDYEVHRKLNLEYTQQMWALCIERNIPLVYASSAATYGNGEYGYKDDHNIINKLQPLNPYGRSKNDFDIWALQQDTTPPFWAGVKFFNVYGPNEFHKGRMASVIFHAYNQIKKDGKVKLFRSHNPKYKDGEQIRDFIYVQDIVNICVWLMEAQPESGLYNAGTGKARTFLALVQAIYKTLDVPEQIEFVDTPIDIRDKYQYFTEADMDKVHAAGFNKPFSSLEEGVKDYVSNYLETGRYY